MSLDRKLDIAGVLMTLVGLLTLLSLLSATNGSLTGTWEAALSRLFGLGMYLFPFTLMIAGLWLVLRNFERIPPLDMARLFGVLLLYWLALVVFHFIGYRGGAVDVMVLAEEGKGGGIIGAFTLRVLLLALGRGGALVAMLGWLLIALALTFDRTVLELFGWAPPLITGIRDWVVDHLPEVRKPSTAQNFLQNLHRCPAALPRKSRQTRKLPQPRLEKTPWSPACTPRTVSGCCRPLIKSWKPAAM